MREVIIYINLMKYTVCEFPYLDRDSRLTSIHPYRNFKFVIKIQQLPLMICFEPQTFTLIEKTLEKFGLFVQLLLSVGIQGKVPVMDNPLKERVGEARRQLGEM